MKWLLTTAHLPIFLFVSALIGFGLYHNVQDSINYSSWTTHTHQVMTDINNCQARMYESDSTFLRYAVSKEPRYLELYKKEKVDFETNVAKLERLTSDNPTQQKNCQNLAEYQRARYESRDLYLGRDIEELRKFATTTENNNIRRNISGVFEQMTQEEQRLLTVRENAFFRSISMIVVLVFFLSIIVIGLVGFVLGESQNQKNVLRTLVTGI